MASIIVVTPTYNEKENLEALVEKIFSLGIPETQMVVVDDNSPDGTGVLADRLAEQYPLRVIHRPAKAGLGTAYGEAFGAILSRANPPDYIIQMDADMSHDPAVIPALIAKVAECDLVLGSRYITGGRIENWSVERRLVSRAGNWYARTILGLPYRDLTGGFKCYRREVLEDLNLAGVSSLGYNFQIETTWRVHKKGYRIAEIPIVFTERKHGVSKFNLGIIMESFVKVAALRFHG